jgi:arylformamidase
MDLDSHELDRVYSPSSVASNFLHTLQDCRLRSDTVRGELGDGEAVRYGPAEREQVWLYEASGTAVPLLVFFHGGYWQEGAAQEAVFAAPEFTRSGISFASVGYTLAPEASLEVIVSRCVVGDLATLLR